MVEGTLSIIPVRQSIRGLTVDGNTPLLTCDETSYDGREYQDTGA